MQFAHLTHDVLAPAHHPLHWCLPSPQVLREFLADFEEKMEIGEEPAIDPSQLSYPSALSSSEAPRGSKKQSAAGGASGAASARGKAARGGAPRPSVPSARGKAPARPSTSAAKPEANRAAAAQAAAMLHGTPSVPPLPLPSQGLHDETDDGAALDVADYENSAPQASAEVSAWKSASMQPAERRPASARPASGGAAGGSGLRSASGSLSARGASARNSPRMPPPPAAFPMGPGLASMSGVIISNSQLNSPRRPKCDPVSAHAKHAAAWKSNSFLSLGVKRHGPPMSSPPPPETLKVPRVRPNSYIVPTAKRRDDLVWQTRQRMRLKDADAGGRTKIGGAKQMVPNRFVPATEKRRDDLRWAVRTEMAWQH